MPPIILCRKYNGSPLCTVNEEVKKRQPLFKIGSLYGNDGLHRALMLIVNIVMDTPYRSFQKLLTTDY